MSGNYGSNQAG